MLLRVEVDPVTGCWIYGRAKTDTGYGVIRHDGVLLYVHRVIAEAAWGPIPEGVHVDHLCRIRACCHPLDLEHVSPAENNQRAWDALTCQNRHRWREETVLDTRDGTQRCLRCLEEGLPRRPRPATHCKHGHELTEANTYRAPKTGKRQCRTCIARRSLEQAKRRRLSGDTPAARVLS